MRPPAQAGWRDTKGLKKNLHYSVREESGFSAHRCGGWYMCVHDRASHSPEVGRVRASTRGTRWLMISRKLTSAVYEIVI